ncbi:hypothetical protein FACS1894217_08390 [Clostridia bacterium]|nr:hypothetical protein FACS1894217_08390 [Clostridia bacterium]
MGLFGKKKNNAIIPKEIALVKPENKADYNLVASPVKSKAIDIDRTFGGFNICNSKNVRLIEQNGLFVIKKGSLSFAVEVKPNTVYRVTRNEVATANDRFRIYFCDGNFLEDKSLRKQKTWGYDNQMGATFRTDESTKYLLIYLGAEKQYSNVCVNMTEFEKSLTSLFTPQKSTYNSDILIRRVRSAWRTSGATNSLIEILDFISQGQWAWKNEDSRIWLIYCACLIEKGEIDGAAKILNIYKGRYGLLNIEKFLTVATFARSIGIRNSSIDKANIVFNQLENNIKNNIFKQYVRGKTIAVVGNGDTEIGKRLGGEIDSHDIVIRFNNYPQGYEADYGNKTTVWVRNGNRLLIDKANLEDFDLVVWEPEFKHTPLQYTQLDVLFRDLSIYPEKVIYFDWETKTKLLAISGITVPTSGCVLLWMLYSALGGLNNVDVYGFSFLKKDYENTKHFYDDLSKMDGDHDPAKEYDFLYTLYWGSKDNGMDSSENHIALVSCAFENKNGIGDVLEQQRCFFGKQFRNSKLLYLNAPDIEKHKRNTSVLTTGLNERVGALFVAADFIQNNEQIEMELNSGAKLLFICHDVGTAYGAYLCGYKYALVYHLTGNLSSNLEAAGYELSEREKILADKIEKIAFENAEKVYFQSPYVREAFVKTSTVVGSFADYYLPNTTFSKGSSSITLEQYELPPKTKKLSVFISISDFSHRAGMERVPEFLEAYVGISGEKVLWIAVGSTGNDKDIYNSLVAAKDNWDFKSLFIGETIGRDEQSALIDYADYFIMLQRDTVFDSAALEAMREKKRMILSDVGGNNELNIADNVVIVHDDNYNIAVRDALKRNAVIWGESNHQVFNEHFSEDGFFKSYAKMMTDELENMGVVFRQNSQVNEQTFKPFKDYYKGKTAVICGSGSSLDGYKPIEGAIHIAINRALFYEAVDFNMLFMHEIPKNQPYNLADYNNYYCDKFYAFDSDSDVARGKLFRFELSPIGFDYRIDDPEAEIDKYCVSNMNSALFSALQFAVFAGFKKIILYGVDFSDMNFNGQANPNIYSEHIEDVFAGYIWFAKKDYPDVEIRIGSTTNEKLKIEKGVNS